MNCDMLLGTNDHNGCAMIKRRTFVVVVGGTLLAGCSANPSTIEATEPDVTETPAPNPTESSPPASTATPKATVAGTPTPDTAFVTEVIREAMDEINLAINDLHFSTRDVEHTDQIPDISTREPELSTEIISELLDEATPEASADQRDSIAALRTFNDQIVASIAVVETTFDIHDGWERGIAYYRSDRLRTAGDELDDQLAPTHEALKRVTAIQDTLIELEPDLGEETPIKTDDFRSFLDDLNAIRNGFTVLITGATILVEGQQEMELGLTAIRNDDSDNDDYDEGVARFTAAIDRLAEAEAVFKAGERREDTRFQNEIIESTCEANRLKAASGFYRKASTEALQRDYDEAMDAMAAGDDELNRAC